MFDAGESGSDAESSAAPTSLKSHSSTERSGRVRGLRPVPVEFTADLPPVLERLVELDGEMRRLEAERARLLGEAERLQLTEREFGHRTYRWWAMVCRRSNGEGRRHVGGVRTVRRFGVLGEALDAGRIGWQHVCLVSSVLNDRVELLIEPFLDALVTLAGEVAFDPWAREVRRIVELLDQDGPTRPDSERSEVRLTPLFDGTVVLDGALCGRDGLVTKELVEAEARRIIDEHRMRGEQAPSWSNCVANALVRLVERGSTVTPGGTTVRPDLVVVFRPEDGGFSTLDGTQFGASLEILEWVLAEGSMRSLEMTATGDPLRMGTAIRFANAEQRIALAAKYQTCAFPGCEHPAQHAVAHHIDPFDDMNPSAGGPTDIENLLPVCLLHHRVIHRDGWSVIVDTSRSPGHPRLTLRTPRGRVFTLD